MTCPKVEVIIFGADSKDVSFTTCQRGLTLREEGVGEWWGIMCCQKVEVIIFDPDTNW